MEQRNNRSAVRSQFPMPVFVVKTLRSTASLLFGTSGISPPPLGCPAREESPCTQLIPPARALRRQLYSQTPAFPGSRWDADRNVHSAFCFVASLCFGMTSATPPLIVPTRVIESLDDHKRERERKGNAAVHMGFFGLGLDCGGTWFWRHRRRRCHHCEGLLLHFSGGVRSRPGKRSSDSLR